MMRFLVRMYVAIMLTTGVAAFSQGTQASLTGNVLDPSNAVIANAGWQSACCIYGNCTHAACCDHTCLYEMNAVIVC